MENYSLDYMQIKDIDDAKEFISDCNGFFHLRISLQYNGKITEENLEILKYLTSYKETIKNHVKKITLCVPYEKIPTNAFNKIVEFHNTFPNIKTEISVWHTLKKSSDDLTENKFWDIDTIIKANLSIDKVCEKIKNSNLTPLEALAFIHKYVSTLTTYKASDEMYWDSTDQHFAGAFSPNKEFVCAGYSSLEKEIIDTLDMPGLKCELISVEVYNRDTNTDGYHSRCMLYVEDKTYNIKRTVFDDPTWDGIFDEDEEFVSPKYTHFMMPLITHEDDVSYKYDYSNLRQLKTNNKAVKNYEYIYPHIDYSSKDVYPLSQALVETIHFNMLSKTSNKSFDEIYDYLKLMAKQSFIEQNLRKFKGALKNEELCLSKNTAKKLYLKNKEINLKNDKNIKNDDFQM